MIGGYWQTADPYEIIAFGVFCVACLIGSFFLR